MNPCTIFCVIFVVLSIDHASAATTLLDKIREDSDLSEFYDLIERNQIAMSNLKLRSLTIFAPTNEAFQKYTGSPVQVQYHMSTTATALEHLGTTITSDFDGTPPLYITKTRKNNQEYIYVNNALILHSRSNIQMVNEAGKKQVLHVIDDILTPLTVNPSSTVDLNNPDAFQFLAFSDSLDIGGYRLRSYRSRVIQNTKESVYQAQGGFTYFVPVEEGFKPHPRPELIDKKVIDGHIIPNRVVFTKSAPIEQPFETLAFEDNIKVTVTFFTQGEGKNMKTYVKSNTVVGDSKHSTGVVLAEIVRANIPVKNGVVHLIHRPLMVVDTTVKQFLESFKIVNEKEDGPLFKFYEVIMDVGGEFMQTVNKMNDITLFAPSNEAWNDPMVQNIIRDRNRMRDILNLHLVRDRLNTERIRQGNTHTIVQIPTAVDRRNLYFNVITNRAGNQTVTVEGAGVNATLIQADIAQMNGYVHIIDRVLGVPFATVYDKLRTDPMLNSTYIMGNNADFNLQLNDTKRRFTYFVPRDWAWQQTEIEFPSTHKKLFMPEFHYHARAILERHLVISDKAFTMADLRSMGNDSIVLPTIRDALTIRVREDGKRYTIQWNHRIIPVFRPDVECTNGIIHVIDHPFLVDSDVHVSGSSHLFNGIQATAILFVANAVILITANHLV